MRVKMEQCGQKLNNFKKIVKKIVNAKATVAFRPCSYTCNIDQKNFCGSQLSVAKTST